MKEAVSDIEELLAQEEYLGVCWACANNNDCKSGNECVPKWRGKKNKTWVLINKSCSKADGSFCPHANICSHVDNRTCPYLEVLDKLCEYEDTGLSPEEVWKLKANKKGE